MIHYNKYKVKINMRKQRVSIDGKTILVTGSPGFIGANLVTRLLRELKSGTVISFDSMNDYYEPELKNYRLQQIEDVVKESDVNHIFIRGNLVDKDLLDRIFKDYKPSIVVNLAAQAGVRYSIENPSIYIESNIIGFFNILEACRCSYSIANNETDYQGVEHLIYASSSSVYGANKKFPFSIDDKVDNPISLYAATKKSDELLAYCYSNLYNIPTTGVRLFTVYGSAGRPDMFYYNATKILSSNGTIKIFNNGDMWRDFTYVDDIV
jgi:nucleoside-diphosphate-sugar epimerase